MTMTTSTSDREVRAGLRARERLYRVRNEGLAHHVRWRTDHAMDCGGSTSARILAVARALEKIADWLPTCPPAACRRPKQAGRGLADGIVPAWQGRRVGDWLEPGRETPSLPSVRYYAVPREGASTDAQCPAGPRVGPRVPSATALLR